MGFQVLKPGETFSILEKLTVTKKFYLRRAYFFDLMNTVIIAKKVDIKVDSFSMQISTLL